jgi:hypothetical protein
MEVPWVGYVLPDGLERLPPQQHLAQRADDVVRGPRSPTARQLPNCPRVSAGDARYAAGGDDDPALPESGGHGDGSILKETERLTPNVDCFHR